MAPQIARNGYTIAKCTAARPTPQRRPVHLAKCLPAVGLTYDDVGVVLFDS